MDAAHEHDALIARNLAAALAHYHEDLETVLASYHGLIAEGGGQEAKPIFEALHFRHLCVADAETGAVLVEYWVSDVPYPARVPRERLVLFNALAHGEKIGVSPVFQPPGEEARLFLSTRVEAKLVIGVIHTDFFHSLQQQVQFGEHGHAVILYAAGGRWRTRRTIWMGPRWIFRAWHRCAGCKAGKPVWRRFIRHGWTDR